MNISELSVGSYILVTLGRYGSLIAQVVEIGRKQLGVMAVRHSHFDSPVTFTIGKIYHFKHSRIIGFDINSYMLVHFGFIPANKKGWSMVYYFGDMMLLYRFDKKKMQTTFRFMSPFSKKYTNIDCHYIHNLQSIMRFLTGGELVFEFNETSFETIVNKMNQRPDYDRANN